MAAALLSFREGLEAALIVGIVLGYLAKIGQGQRARSAWAGVIVASVLSLVLALFLNAVGAEFEGAAEEIFEGVTMLLAAGVLTWMIFWMHTHGTRIRGELEGRVRSAATTGSDWPLFSLTFLAVLREGVELALFLTAAVYASSPVETLVGAGLGLLAAVTAGWLIFVSTRRLDVRRFFQLTGLLLLVFAAGLVGQGFHELHEAGLIPGIVDHIWSTKALLNDKSSVGALLKALVGYNDDPPLIQVLTYIGYVVAVVAALLLRRSRTSLSPDSSPS